jgi:hypothetical protein
VAEGLKQKKIALAVNIKVIRLKSRLAEENWL